MEGEAVTSYQFYHSLTISAWRNILAECQETCEWSAYRP
jgi:hypothetical protein